MEIQPKKPVNKFVRYIMYGIVSMLTCFGLMFCFITGKGIIDGVGIGLKNLTTTPFILPTDIKPPTAIPSFTSSPKPTSTKTPTATPTITRTFTLAPGTLTKQAFYAEATQRSAAVTATVARQLEIRFGTETAAAALYQKKLDYKWIEVRELVTYPDHHKGEKVIVQGYIFNILNDKQMQMQIGDYPTEPIIVYMAEAFYGIYENDYIRVYGTVAGKECGTNAFGADICQPLLIDAFWEPREGAQ